MVCLWCSASCMALEFSQNVSVSDRGFNPGCMQLFLADNYTAYGHIEQAMSVAYRWQSTESTYMSKGNRARANDKRLRCSQFLKLCSVFEYEFSIIYNKIIISITQKGQLTKHVAQQWGSKNVDSLASMGPEINIYVQTKLFAIQCSGQFDYYND